VKISNLAELVCDTHPPPLVRDFPMEQRDQVFGERSWGNVLKTLAVLVKLQLLTLARRRRPSESRAAAVGDADGGSGSSGAWVQATAKNVSVSSGQLRVAVTCCVNIAFCASLPGRV
jgi:hypothetical protein